MPKTNIDSLPVEIVEQIVQLLAYALPSEWPYCLRSTFGALDYKARHESIYTEPFDFWEAPFPVGLLALSSASKRYRDICQQFIYRAQVKHTHPSGHDVRGPDDDLWKRPNPQYTK